MFALHMTLTVKCAARCLLCKWFVKFSAVLFEQAPGSFNKKSLCDSLFLLWEAMSQFAVISEISFGNTFLCNLFPIFSMTFKLSVINHFCFLFCTGIRMCFRFKLNKTSCLRDHLILCVFFCENLMRTACESLGLRLSRHYKTTWRAEWFMFCDPFFIHLHA